VLLGTLLGAKHPVLGRVVRARDLPTWLWTKSTAAALPTIAGVKLCG
jgi:hypothetical protein